MGLKRFLWIAPTTVLLIVSQTFRLNFPMPFVTSRVVAQTSDVRKAEAKRLFVQGGQQIGNSQFQAAIQSLQQALSIYREIKDRLGEGWTLRQIGYAYQSLKDYPKAIDYYQQSLVVALEIEDFGLEAIGRADIEVAQSESNPRIAEADRLRNQGRQQYQTNQFEAALQSWQQALSIYQETKERQGEGLMLRDLGNAYDSLGDYPKAIEYHQQYLAVARETEDRLSEGFALLYLNNSYANQGIQQFENNQFEAAIQ